MTIGEGRPDVVRLVAERLDVRWTVAEAALRLRGDDHPFVLSGAWAGGGALIGSDPVRIADVDEDPFALLDEQPEVVVDGAMPDGVVGGGWVGMLGFALAHRVERLPPPPPARTSLPAFALAFYDHLLRRDAGGCWWFEALWTPARADALADRREALVRRRAAARPFAAGPFAPAAPGIAGHRAAVAQCVQRIAAGELFQANLTMRLEGAFAGDPLDAFAAGLAVAPRYGAYLAGPWGATAGLSPELFLRRRGREVVTRPIKGTIARLESRAEDGAAAQLLESDKDRAENVMIVDLMRNDLGRVCAYGTVQADPTPSVEAHPGVWHLVSDVRGRLRDDVGDRELLHATFPPGSVTGAPKVQALRVISELEGSARHAYTGAVGFASPVGGLELNVVIRTFEIRDGMAWIGVGGGIVADSDPDAEVREALTKARPLLRALGARLHEEPSARSATPPARALDGGLQRPDPALGVFETIAVRAGEPARLQEHLARLGASVAEVLGEELPDDLVDRVCSALAGATAPLLRLRIDAFPAPGGIAIELAVREAKPVDDTPVAVHAVLLPGGLGAHKWRDRRLLEALDQRHGGMPLIVDADGAVLEAAIANVWLLEGDTLITPPADGRLLPGVTRSRVLARVGTCEEPFDLQRLRAADAVLLTSSIGLVRVAGGSPAPALVSSLRDELACGPCTASCAQAQARGVRPT
ncbi:MAG: Chorismate binding-like protein [Solirubrobacterales bacterium]|nr:Chorismate binding-like protein [Solirubrobacterales bacterium]